VVDPYPRTIFRNSLIKTVAKEKKKSKREETMRKLRDAGLPD
jgi:hypothetical protein